MSASPKQQGCARQLGFRAERLALRKSGVFFALGSFVSLWIFVLYLLSQFALGWWVSRRVHSEEDFFVAGRKLGAPLLAFSLFATWFGAETCLGAAGAVYSSGLSGARADPLGYALCLLLMGVLLVKRLYQGRYLTLGDLFCQRYGPVVERLGVLVLVPSSLIWAAAQVRAFGQVIAATSSIHVTSAIYLSSAIVIGYTYLGGLLGDVVTDFFQGLLMALCLGLLVFVAVDRAGGLATAFSHVEPRRWSLLVEGESAWAQIDRWSVPILGSLIAQELMARVFSARSLETARRATYWSALIYILLGACPVLLGLLGPQLMPNLAQPEQLLPHLSKQLLPPVLQALFSCSLVAAILSTVDSILLASSALIAHNVLTPTFQVKTERNKLLLARLCVVVFGIAALVIALYADGIYELVETASAFGTAGVLVVTLAALYLPWGGQLAATAALGVGAVAAPVLTYGWDVPAPFLGSILCAVLAYCLAAWIGEPRKTSRGT